MTSRERTKKRLLVIKDALKLVQTHPNLRVSQRNGYVVLRLRPHSNLVLDQQLREYRTQSAPMHTDSFKDSKYTVCEVCALGALFLAHIDRYNRLTVREALDPEWIKTQIDNKLGELFTQEELDWIEIAFENSHNRDRVPKGLMDAAFGKFDTERLVAILEYLIENKGEVGVHSQAAQA